MSVCTNCDANNWVVDQARGDYICCDCGMVREDVVVDPGLERRNFADSDADHNRGQVVDPYLSSLSTTTITRKKLKVAEQAATDLAMVQKSLTAPTSLTDQHLETYFKKIRELASFLELEGRVVDTAKDLIFRYEKAKGHHRRTLDIMAACLAVLHLACGHLQLGRPLADLLMDLHLAACLDLPDEREVWAARKKIVEQLPGIDVAMRPEDVIHNFCTTLQVSRAVRRVAMYIHARIQPFVEGKTASTIAGGCILLACQALDVAIDRDDVGGVAQVATTTLLNFCKIGKRNWGIIVPTAQELATMSDII